MRERPASQCPNDGRRLKGASQKVPVLATGCRSFVPLNVRSRGDALRSSGFLLTRVTV
jgi:hypothetical protein